MSPLFPNFDYRGSTVAITDTTGQVIDTVQYSPFGVVLSQPTFDTPFLFNGLYGVMTDDNSLSYMRARYYSAEIRRFVNQDVLLGNVTDGQSLNRFAFVIGNPIRYNDPWGLEIFDWTDGFDTSGYEDGDGAALNRDQSIEMLLLTIDVIDLGSDLFAACTALPSGGASLALNFQKKALVEAIERALKEYLKKEAKNAKTHFPIDPDELTKALNVPPKISTTQHGTVRMTWEPSSNVRIRYESHPRDLGTYNPRHHGEHYHVEIKPSNLSWNQAKRRGETQKVKPENYQPGHGTGFLPDEAHPGDTCCM